MPDGDVFGVKIDKCWREAGDLLEAGAPFEEIMPAMVRGTKEMIRQWEGLPEVDRFVEMLVRADPQRIDHLSPGALVEQIDNYVRPPGVQERERILAEATKRLLGKAESIRGYSKIKKIKLRALLCERAIVYAATADFLDRAIPAAYRNGRYTIEDALELHTQLGKQMVEFARSAGRQLSKNPSRTSVYLRAPAQTVLRKTEDLLHEPLCMR